MKIRTGFVSNSSSSSFCIVGVSGEWGVKMLMVELGYRQEERPNHGFDCECKKCMAIASMESDPSRPPDKDKYGYSTSYGRFSFRSEVENSGFHYYGSQYDVEAAGLLAEEVLVSKTLEQAKKEFQARVKKTLGLDIPVGEVKLLYGESGEG